MRVVVRVYKDGDNRIHRAYEKRQVANDEDISDAVDEIDEFLYDVQDQIEDEGEW